MTAVTILGVTAALELALVGGRALVLLLEHRRSCPLARGVRHGA